MLTCGLLKSTYTSGRCCSESLNSTVDPSLLLTPSLCESVYKAKVERPTPHIVLPSGCVQSLRKTGGTLYIYNESSPVAEWSEIIDLGERVMTSTESCFPRSTPHMVLPSPSHDLVAISYTADSFVHLMDVKTRQIVSCLSVSHVEGSLIHTGSWYSYNNRLYFVMVDMTGKVDGATGGGGLHLWEVEGTNSTLLHSWSAPLSLGLLTSETKPIATGGHYTNPNGVLYVTDAKQGGGYFVDISTREIVLVGHITMEQLAPECNHGGGLWVYPHPERDDRLVAQYGTQVLGKSCLVDLNIHTKQLIRKFSLSPNALDAHGLVFCEAGGHQYMMNTNRVSRTMDIVNYTSGTLERSDIDLNDLFYGHFAPVDDTCVDSPPPDETDKRFQPDVLSKRGNILYQPTRGRHPFSAVAPNNRLPYAAPGLYSYRMSEDCLSVYRSEDDISLPAHDATSTLKAADPHGGDVVGEEEVWMIDQAPTGLTVYCDDVTLAYVPNMVDEPPRSCPGFLSPFPPSPPPADFSDNGMGEFGR